MIDQLPVLLVAFLGSGSVAAFFGYLNSRKTTKIDYSESVAKTLTEFNDLLKKEVGELREENSVLRRKVRNLEDRIATIERDGRSSHDS
jgi:hypothetical protein